MHICLKYSLRGSLELMCSLIDAFCESVSPCGFFCFPLMSSVVIFFRAVRRNLSVL